MTWLTHTSQSTYGLMEMQDQTHTGQVENSLPGFIMKGEKILYTPITKLTTDWLAQVVECQTTKWNVLGSRRMCCLYNDICKWLDVVVFSDKDDKP